LTQKAHVPTFGVPVAGYPYIVRPSAYALVRNETGDIALVCTPRGSFLPGGGIEQNETAAEAMRRETCEECGLVVHDVAIVGEAIEIVLSIAENACFEKRSVFIAAKVVASVEQIELDHHLVWVDPLEAVNRLAHASHGWAVRRWYASFAHRRGP